MGGARREARGARERDRGGVAGQGMACARRGGQAPWPVARRPPLAARRSLLAARHSRRTADAGLFLPPSRLAPRASRLDRGARTPRPGSAR